MGSFSGGAFLGNFSRKGVKFVCDNIYATHTFCVNHRLHWRIKRPHRYYNLIYNNFMLRLNFSIPSKRSLSGINSTSLIQSSLMLHSNRLQNVICVGVAQCDTEERVHLKLFYKKYYCICHFLCGRTIGLYCDR